MHELSPILASLVLALGLAFALGLAARALHLPPLIGYLAAGLVVGPHTPGFVADAGFTTAMAEVGVALLLFGVGLHFRTRDLLAVWRIALPGAVLQIGFGTWLSFQLGRSLLGLDVAGALVFGLALAISSTAVSTRTLEERGLLRGEAGRIALGWLVVQDLVVVLALVLLPALAAGGGDERLGHALAATAAELAGFLVAMFLGGRVLLPRLLGLVAASGSRELFTLAVITIALGTAFGSAWLFGVSAALGAFFAGVLLGESDLGHQAAAETAPLQRLFVALFFVSVGMMVDPLSVLAAPGTALAALAAVLVGTGGAIFVLLVAMRVSIASSATVAGAMAQVGEFSFVLVELAARQGVLDAGPRGPVLAAAVAAIIATPFVLGLAQRLAARLEGEARFRAWQARRAGARAFPPLAPQPAGHTILVGHGRVGRMVARALSRHGLPFVVIETERAEAEALRRDSVPVIWGDAARPEVLAAARPEGARMIVLALPDTFTARRVLDLAHAANPAIGAAARAHDEEEAVALAARAGMGLVVMGEREVALGLAGHLLERLGVAPGEAMRTLDALRGAPDGADQAENDARGKPWA